MSNEMAKVRLRVREIAEARGFSKAHALQLAMKISPSKAKRLWDGDMDKIALDTIYDLCAFLQCSPTDLFAKADDSSWPKDFYRRR